MSIAENQSGLAGIESSDRLMNLILMTPEEL